MDFRIAVRPAAYIGRRFEHALEAFKKTSPPSWQVILARRKEAGARIEIWNTRIDSPYRPEEQDHAARGQAWHAAPRTLHDPSAPARIYIFGAIMPAGRQGCRLGPAVLQ